MVSFSERLFFVSASRYSFDVCHISLGGIIINNMLSPKIHTNYVQSNQLLWLLVFV